MRHKPATSERPRRALTNERCRELLGTEARDLSDDEIDALRRHAEAMAHMLIDMYLSRRTPQP